MIEPLLLTATRVSTFDGQCPLTGASGFFFEREGRLFLVTSRHVVRQALIASSFGVRFQGLGFFLTDARTHRGTSGAPVVMHSSSTGAQLPWKLLGVHSARMDMASRDLQLDETLGLNCAWYADI